MRIINISALILIGFLVAALLPMAQPSAVNAALPPRPTLTPTPENIARILLKAGSAYEGAWTVVQWQGGDGVWHDVEGWRGHVRDGRVRWRVAQKDWGTGPFRWVVYDEAGGELLAASGSFTLPTSGWTMVIVQVTPVGQGDSPSP